MPDEMPWSRFRAEIYALFGRNPRSNRMMAELAEPGPDHVTLDIGCGPGAAVRAVAPLVARAVGVDNSASMVRIAARRSGQFDNVEFRTGSAEALPFPEGSFDRVWTVHAFHHWSDQSVGIAEAMRVLRPGGRFLIVERDTTGDHGLTKAEAAGLSERLAEAGFRDAVVEMKRKELVVIAER